MIVRGGTGPHAQIQTPMPRDGLCGDHGEVFR